MHDPIRVMELEYELGFSDTPPPGKLTVPRWHDEYMSAMKGAYRPVVPVQFYRPENDANFNPFARAATLQAGWNDYVAEDHVRRQIDPVRLAWQAQQREQEYIAFHTKRLSELDVLQSDTEQQSTHVRSPKMADTAPEFSPRQITALTAVGNGAITAKQVAEAIEPGSDARGAAQTLRRLSDFVGKNADGEYKLTRKGTNLVKRHSSDSE